jgi:hypothetical protein
MKNPQALSSGVSAIKSATRSRRFACVLDDLQQERWLLLKELRALQQELQDHEA